MKLFEIDHVAHDEDADRHPYAGSHQDQMAALEQLRKKNNALVPDPLAQAAASSAAAELAPEALPGPARSGSTWVPASDQFH